MLENFAYCSGGGDLQTRNRHTWTTTETRDGKATGSLIWKWKTKRRLLQKETYRNKHRWNTVSQTHIGAHKHGRKHKRDDMNMQVHRRKQPHKSTGTYITQIHTQKKGRRRSTGSINNHRHRTMIIDCRVSTLSKPIDFDKNCRDHDLWETDTVNLNLESIKTTSYRLTCENKKRRFDLQVTNSQQGTHI